MNEVLRLATTPTAVIPVDIETTAMLASELRRLYRENQFLKHDLYDCAKACEQIAAAEREACAQVCDETVAHQYMKQVIPARDEAMLLAACADCAAAIRSRT